MVEEDYSKYYDLEHYLFSEISPRFAATESLSAFEFFCIIIWKANRSKTRVAGRLLKKGQRNLDNAVQSLVSEIVSASSSKEKLKVLLRGWGFLLPTASAILTVLYPKEFTVYDVRVCGLLNKFGSLKNKSNFEKVWEGYQAYVLEVKEIQPPGRSLRDNDRWLWGRSFAEQLRLDLQQKFTRRAK